jgi:hypothetical protein
MVLTAQKLTFYPWRGSSDWFIFNKRCTMTGTPLREAKAVDV